MDTDAMIATPLRLGPVRLAVRDAERAGAFYEAALGLAPIGSDGAGMRLGAGGRPLVELMSRPDAAPAPRGVSGLFHLAILVPARADLADALARMVHAGATLAGASDHLVSEALYLNDPEGNGIEVYRDRPSEQWARRDGRLLMDTLPLDLNDLIEERSAGAPPARMPEGTTLGHVHLRVDDLESARRFYVGVLGLEVTVDTYPGALFVAAGGYHHHIGLNTWMSRAPAAPGALGLIDYEIAVPADRLAGIAARAADPASGGPVQAGPDGALRLADPAGNAVVVRPAAPQDAAAAPRSGSGSSGG